MKAVVLAEMLRETLEAKINKIRREIQVTYMPIEVERLEAQIMAIQWVQARIGFSCQQQPRRRQRHQDKDIERKSIIQMKIKVTESPYTENYTFNYNTAKAPNSKHNLPEVKDVCYFAERVRHMLDVENIFIYLLSAFAI
jgi:hypothetical protein